MSAMVATKDVRPQTWRYAIRGRILRQWFPVAHALAVYADKNGDNANPGIQQIADDIPASPSTVKRALAGLVAEGWLRRRHAGRRAGQADVYQLTVPVVLGVTDDPYNEPEDEVLGVTGDPYNSVLGVTDVPYNEPEDEVLGVKTAQLYGSNQKIDTPSDLREPAPLEVLVLPGLSGSSVARPGVPPSHHEQPQVEPGGPPTAPGSRPAGHEHLPPDPPAGGVPAHSASLRGHAYEKARARNGPERGRVGAGGREAPRQSHVITEDEKLAGIAAFEAWMAEEKRKQESARKCAADDCDNLFNGTTGQRYCTKTCKNRVSKRRVAQKKRAPGRERA